VLAIDNYRVMNAFFVRYEVNVKKGSKTAKELRTLTTLADLKVIPVEDRS